MQCFKTNDKTEDRFEIVFLLQLDQQQTQNIKFNKKQYFYNDNIENN